MNYTKSVIMNSEKNWFLIFFSILYFFSLYTHTSTHTHTLTLNIHTYLYKFKKNNYFKRLLFLKMYKLKFNIYPFWTWLLFSVWLAIKLMFLYQSLPESMQNIIMLNHTNYTWNKRFVYFKNYFLKKIDCRYSAFSVT